MPFREMLNSHPPDGHLLEQLKGFYRDEVDEAEKPACMSDSYPFRAKRGDTKVASVEATYRINLNARGDMLLGNLLDERGFDSLTQLLEAYRQKLTFHPRKRRLFLSFHAEDKPQVQGFRLMAMNPNVDLDFYDSNATQPRRDSDAELPALPEREKLFRSYNEMIEDWNPEQLPRLSKPSCGVLILGAGNGLA